MKTWPTLIAVVALAFAAACSSAPEPAPKAPAAAKADTPKAAAKAKAGGAKTAEERADELIADLKKREEGQAKIHEQVTGRVPVVVEVSPKERQSQPFYVGPGVYPGSSPSSGINSSDANYWRQEFTIASARMATSQKRLEDAQRKMSEAQQQASNPNAPLRKMAQDAYTRAQEEYRQAQSAFYEDQSAVNRARSSAMNAGVPASQLR